MVVLFSPDRRRVMVRGSWSAAIHLVRPGDLLAVAACRVARGLTPEEQRAYATGRPLLSRAGQPCPPPWLR